MIASLTLILFCQLVGEVIARGLGWPIPGPVLGMIVMLAALGVRDRIRKYRPAFGRQVDATGQGLLAHLSLLFIPAGVGVMQRLDILTEYGWALLVALVVSTFITLVVTVLAFVFVSRLTETSARGGEGSSARE
ncbi:CidA/LrgA family protein [Microvirga rosea]|uniref:CidA/LrgA family protein n=1 Tax=Microvirga rosea TaxID=2715425 RepID=UPI001D0A184A|nr:CidA/LrgA family protein [Microvirga rosea]MCB8821506.1 CidA/LrgA family protein [Microvirga rosea]